MHRVNGCHRMEQTHYVIVGNGVAGIEAAMEIRSRYGPGEAAVTVVGEETEYFFSRTALMYAYMNWMNRRDLEPYERRMYDRNAIRLIHDRAVDLDADRQVLRLRDGPEGKGAVLNYDRLLLAVGSKPRMIPFDGLQSVETGVVNFVSMQDLDECEGLTPSTDRAVVVGGGLIGVELVECLVHHGVEVTFLVREPFFWPVGLHREEGETIAEHIAAHDGVDLRLSEELREVHAGPDGRVEAVTTNRENRLPCQMLGIAIGVTPNVDWLEAVRSPPVCERGIRVDRGFETSLENVWAAGDCAEIGADDPSERQTDDEPFVEQIWYSAERQGELAGRAMMGDDVQYERPTFYNSAKFMDIEYTTVGEVVGAPQGATSLYRKMPDEPISQRIIYDEETERVLGFNMLGSRWDHRYLERWIENRRSLEWVLDQLREAQFDVEFGRVPLEKMHEEQQSLDAREYEP